MTVPKTVKGVAGDVAEQRCAENFYGIRPGIDDVDEWIGGDDEAEERGTQSHDGGPAKPAGEPVAQCRRAYQWNGEHGDVREFIVRDGRIGKNLKGLLRVDADVCKKEKDQDQSAGEPNGVDRRPVSRMQASEPCRNEVVPARSHGET